MFPGRRCW